MSKYVIIGRHIHSEVDWLHLMKDWLRNYNLMDMKFNSILFPFNIPIFLFPGTTQYSSDPAPKDLVIRTRINSVNPFNWWSVGNELKNMKPDIIIVRFWLPFMGPALGTILRRVRKNKHTKIVAIVDNIIPHEKRPGDKIFAKYFVKSLDKCVVMSKSVGEDLKSFVKQQPIHYVSHPMYDNYGKIWDKKLAREKLGLHPDGKYIMFFGFIRKYKGLDILYHAMKDSRIRENNIRLIIAGEYYADEKFYADIAKENGILDLLELHTDYISNERVKYYFSAADLIAQPYKTATQSGISQLAYHFEKPMLVTNVGGLPEIVNHGEAGYVTEVEPKDIADAIVDYYINHRESEFVEKVKENKKRFSWSNLVDTINK